MGVLVEVCCCGNTLRETSVRIVVSPCRCETPGPGQRQRPRWFIPEALPEKQYEERKRLGLPLMDEIEKAHFNHRWR